MQHAEWIPPVQLSIPRARAVLGGAVLILALSATACTSGGGSSPSATPSTSAGTTSPSTAVGTGTGSGPPTASATASATAPQATDTPVVGAVSPVVTYSGYDPGSAAIQAAAFVDGVQRSAGGDPAGTCVLTVTAPDGTTRTASAPATADATTTQCGTVSVALRPSTPGTWSGVVSYSSATAAGSSAPFTVEVTP